MAEEDNNLDNVVPFTGSTFLDLPAEDVLEGALEAGLDLAIVIGFKQDGSLYCASTTGSLLEILGTLDMARFSYLFNQESH
jgi:hypothetical protein